MLRHQGVRRLLGLIFQLPLLWRSREPRLRFDLRPPPGESQPDPIHQRRERGNIKRLTLLVRLQAREIQQSFSASKLGGCHCPSLSLVGQPGYLSVTLTWWYDATVMKKTASDVMLWYNAAAPKNIISLFNLNTQTSLRRLAVRDSYCLCFPFWSKALILEENLQDFFTAQTLWRCSSSTANTMKVFRFSDDRKKAKRKLVLKK